MAPTDQIAWDEAANSLLDHLRGHCGYAIGVDGYLRVQRLLLSLAPRGALPQEPQQLEGLVRPLVCQSTRDQEAFAEHFKAWVGVYDRRPGIQIGPQDPIQPLNQVLDDVGRWKWRWIAACVIGTLVLAAIVALVRVLPATPAPILQPSAAYRLSPVVGAWALFTLIATASFFLWRRAKADAFLLQREPTGPAVTTNLVVEESDSSIYDSRLLSLAAQGLGQYRRLPSPNLNIPASVEATTKAGGRFVPVQAHRPTVPEYLVLIDRGSSSDLFARFADGIVRRIEEGNVAVERYYFDRIPQQCYTRRGNRPVTIRELAERMPDHRIIVFSDGAGFFNPATSRYAPWMDVFAVWEFRILFTPNPRDYWSAREDLLSRAGWTVAPSEQGEMAAMAQQVEPEKTGGFVPGLLGSVIADERRWLRRSAPPPGQIEDLIADLRISLGASAFFWLCACAVYPAIDWAVALHLGINLRDDTGAPLLRETSFLALSRLPWFRHGKMPDWLRIALLHRMPEPQRRQVRQLLQTLLIGAAVGTPGTVSLEIQQERGSSLTWLTRRLIRRKRAKTNDEDVLRDQVFVDFLSRKDPVALPLPERLAKLLRSGSLSWRGNSGEARPKKTRSALKPMAILGGVRILAAACYLWPAVFLLGWLEAVLLLLSAFLAALMCRRNSLVRFHLIQGTALLICEALGFLIAATLFTGEKAIASIAALGFAILSVVMAVQAARGKTARLPLIGNFALRFANRVTSQPSSAPPTSPLDLKNRVAQAEARDAADPSRLRLPKDADYWVRIGPGEFPFGEDGERVKLAAFQIGRYPVTVWEYGKYLEQTGAERPRDWDEQVRHPGRPVVSVTWHDAQKYCAWAGCALPTEQQWEAAARGPEGRIYPWGSAEPDERRANFSMMVGAPTPVGMFPGGNTPEGVSDLAGNVWEWTRSDYDGESKVVRGACFDFDAAWLRAAVRPGCQPGSRHVSDGFRCVRE